jgi:hypothetical protein
MAGLPNVSILSWLIAFGPLITLLVGFVGTDRWLRWLFGETRPRSPRERRKGCKVIR